MNKSEKQAYDYILSLEYKQQDIKYSHYLNPDFVTSDSKGWECKTVKNGKVVFTDNQLMMSPDVQILIFLSKLTNKQINYKY